MVFLLTTFVLITSVQTYSIPVLRHIASHEYDLTSKDFELATRLTEQEMYGDANDPIPEEGGYHEGDLVLKYYDDSAERSATKKPNRNWHGGTVPYSISKKFVDKERAVIAAAISEYTTKSCVQFIPRHNQSDYIYFGKGKGCYSSVGRTGGRQTLSLGKGCVKKGTALHEIMHALGFYHEHSRTDRNDHIDIQWNNIKTKKERNFKKYSTKTIDHMGQAYDYQSILHYGKKSFSKNGNQTIIPLNPRSAKIGQRKKLSETDIKKIQIMYHCGNNDVTDVTEPDVTRVNQYLPSSTGIPSLGTTHTKWPSTTHCNDRSFLCREFAEYWNCEFNSFRKLCRQSCNAC